MACRFDALSDPTVTFEHTLRAGLGVTVVCLCGRTSLSATQGTFSTSPGGGAATSADGTIQLSLVYHEWRKGGFTVWVEQQRVRAWHLRHDPRATVLMAKSHHRRSRSKFGGSARSANASAARYIDTKA